MVGTVLLIMLGTTLMYHLGFPEAVARIVLKVARCPKCVTFWVVLFATLNMEYELWVSIGLSFLMAYCSLWVSLLFGLLTNLYNLLWQKLNNKK